MTEALGGVLVPLDGSETAEQALAVGASLARRAGAPLHLVSVQEPVPAAVAVELDTLGGPTEQEARAELGAYLRGVSGGVRDAQAIEVREEVLDGHAAEAIAAYAERHRVGLVVMTTHARRGLGRLLLGSVADGLLRRTTVPVLLLHPRELPQPTRFGRLLVALDGDIEGPAVAAALALTSLEPAPSCLLVRVVEPPIPVVSRLAAASPTHTRAERPDAEEARAYLEAVADRLRSHGIEVSWRVVTGHDIPGLILALARSSAADCIVVGTHRVGRVERMLLGSVAAMVVREGAVPVLVAPVAPVH